MQTPLNKRVIGRHVGQKRKREQTRAEQSQRRVDWSSQRRASTVEPTLRTGDWSTQPVASIGYANDLPWQVAACHSSPPVLLLLLPPTFPFACLEQAMCQPCHLLGGRATKIKTKQRFPIKATTWPPDNVATPPARNDSMRFDSGLVAKESHNSRPVIMRQMRAALAAWHRHRRRRCCCCCRCQLYNVI